MVYNEEDGVPKCTACGATDWDPKSVTMCGVDGKTHELTCVNYCWCSQALSPDKPHLKGCMDQSEGVVCKKCGNVQKKDW